MPRSVPPRLRPRRRRGVGWLLPLLLLAGIAVAAGAGIWMHQVLAGFGPKVSSNPMSLLEKPFDGKQKIFLLILGVDEKNRLHKTDARRSDTMILAEIDRENKRVAALSLPRDTRVRIPGRDHYEKLNAAHSYGGVPLVKQTISDLLGIPIDRYIKTDVNGFRAVVDLIGPVEINVEKRMDYDDSWGNLHIHLKPGRQALNGEKAMEYVRFRHDATGDLGRMKRQQKFLCAVAAKMVAMGNLPRLPLAIETGMKYVDTDMTPREMGTLALLFRNISVSQIATATLPGTPRYIDRVSYVVPDADAIPGLLQKMFFTTPVASASVAVLNGNGLPGIASQAAKRLAAAGVKVSRMGNADNYDYEATEVRAVRGQKDEAKKIASALGISQDAVVDADAQPQGAQVTVVLGKDYRP